MEGNMEYSPQSCNIKEVTWDQVRDRVHKLNPELATIIDELSPGKNYPLYIAKYPYGSMIVKKGCFQLPNNLGSIIPLTESLDNVLKKNLAYNVGSNPVSIVLENSVEIFLSLHNRAIPAFGLFPQGAIMSTWIVSSDFNSLQPAFLWDVTAGARSIFMLPKISKKKLHQRLKLELGIKEDIPQCMMDHHQIFKEISANQNYCNLWTTEILFFSESWFKYLDDNAWIKFKNYLLSTAWRGSEFFRNQFIWNLIFSLIQQERSLKPDPYIDNTTKHLLTMAVGAAPGFSPAIDNSAAPIKEIQQAYTEIYRLENYMPIIMQPLSFSERNKYRPVYYSIQYPTSLEFSLKSNKEASALSDIYATKSLLDKYLRDLGSNQLNIETTEFYKIAQSVSFDFFHSDPRGYTGIKYSKEIIDTDKSFLKFTTKNNFEFPDNSSFFQGCIKIAKKSD
jgi:hypothetical protein